MLFNRLSWGLLYAALVTTMSILMSIIATYTALFPNSDFFVIFFLIFLYGISSVSRAGMEGNLYRCVTLFKGLLHPNYIVFFSHSDLRNVHVPSLSAILCSPLLLSFSLASQIFFSFMLTPLFKKPKFASTVGSMLTVVFGCLSLFTVLMKDFPQPLVWLLCLLSPSAFSIGIAQVTNTQTCLNSHILLDWSCFVMKYLISP